MNNNPLFIVGLNYIKIYLLYFFGGNQLNFNSIYKGIALTGNSLRKQNYFS